MSQAVLNKDNIATTAGDITVFNFDGSTREYISSSEEFLPVGVGIPANSSTDSPGEHKAGFAICRTSDFKAWEYVADHRGETVYSIETGETITVSMIGDYPINTTTSAPATPYDAWDGKKWVTNTDAQHAADVEAADQQKAVLLVEAQETISFWQTELQLGIISDEDKASLIVWMQYIKAVQSVDTSKAPVITWPTAPVEKS
jgi:hypothetical protein